MLKRLTSYRSGLGSTLTPVQLPRSSRPRSEQRRRDGASAGGADFGGCAPEAARLQLESRLRGERRSGGAGGALGGLDRGSDRGVKVGGLAAGRILTVSPPCAQCDRHPHPLPPVSPPSLSLPL